MSIIKIHYTFDDIRIQSLRLDADDQVQIHATAEYRNGRHALVEVEIIATVIDYQGLVDGLTGPCSIHRFNVPKGLEREALTVEALKQIRQLIRWVQPTLSRQFPVAGEECHAN
jgi:hypothetical protein